MRATSSGSPLAEFLVFISTSARWIASAARTGPLGVILLRVRIAEKRHQPITEALEDMAAEPGYSLRRLVEIRR
jgi:hypothetical protein